MEKVLVPYNLIKKLNFDYVDIFLWVCVSKCWKFTNIKILNQLNIMRVYLDKWNVEVKNCLSFVL